MRGYIWRSANDCPTRDPKKWDVLARKVNIQTNQFNEDELVVVSSIWEYSLNEDRYADHRFVLDMPVWTNKVVLRIHENCGAIGEL